MNSPDTIRRHDLHRRQPGTLWRQGIPTGNGLLGTMVWGGPDIWKMTLDRSDLWLRPPNAPGSRTNAGTLSIAMGGGVFEEGLDLHNAIGWRCTSQVRCDWLVHAVEPTIAIRLVRAGGDLPTSLSWRPPRLWDDKHQRQKRYIAILAKQSPTAAVDPYAGHVSSSIVVNEGIGLCQLHAWGKVVSTTRLSVWHGGEPVSMSTDGHNLTWPGGYDELLLLVQVFAGESDALIGDARVWDVLLGDHRMWWHAHWATSGLSLSHATAERWWHLGKYFIGCNMRSSGPPVPLQGVWGEDAPPWWGAYTWDLNVQACYWPVCQAGHADTIEALLTWHESQIPNMEARGRDVYGVAGALLSLNSDLEGVPLSQFGEHPTNAFGVWNCHVIWEFYRANPRKDVLVRIMPILASHLRLQQVLWQIGNDGRYHLDNATSPEITLLAESPSAIRDTAFEIAMARALASYYLHAYGELGGQDVGLAVYASDFLARAVDYPSLATHSSNYFWPVDPGVPDYWVEWPGLDAALSHRHFSHLMMIAPLGNVHSRSPRRDRAIAHNSLHRLMMRGTACWECFSFPWASLLNTRMGWRPRLSFHLLDQLRTYLAEPFNGLALNGDFQGYGLFNQTGPYGPDDLGVFTIESNFMAMAAVQEAVLFEASGALITGEGLTEDIEGTFHGWHVPGRPPLSGRIDRGQVQIEDTCVRKSTHA
ncbi:MAG: glycoside hydrolase N-terminal domain-containing protein [Lentisphaerae bacterium]|nr:glycoside hydrolase N-terminal domain-containing protein [Lentisphaerota bacterium]